VGKERMSSKMKEKISEDRIFGSYLFVNYTNKGKLEKINQVFTEYRKTAKDISKFLWDIFFHTGKLSHRKKINIKHIPSYLSERYKYVCLWQTYDILSSYIAQRLVNNFVSGLKTFY
jgi:putative transposase